MKEYFKNIESDAPSRHFPCLKLTIETVEQGVKHVQS